uniref:Deoxyuridine 5'-triphosphate nucleotidohydrolase n=1 Tax=Strigops habroptila TaxID=2489341 RepID=A0A672UC35_STRHB
MQSSWRESHLQVALAPYRATPDAAGLDLYSLQMHRLNIRGICVIDTDIGVYIPSGYFGLIAPRSTLAIKGVQILGGIIDSDYQGEIKVILLNSDQVILIQLRDHVAQMLILPVLKAQVRKGEEAGKHRCAAVL